MEAKSKQIVMWGSIVAVLIVAVVAMLLLVSARATAREKAKVPGVVDMSSSEVKAVPAKSAVPNLSGTKVAVPNLSGTKVDLSKTKVK